MGQEMGRRPRGVDFQNRAEYVPWELQNLLEKFPGMVLSPASDGIFGLAPEAAGRVRTAVGSGGSGLY